MKKCAILSALKKEGTGSFSNELKLRKQMTQTHRNIGIHLRIINFPILFQLDKPRQKAILPILNYLPPSP